MIRIHVVVVIKLILRFPKGKYLPNYIIMYFNYMLLHCTSIFTMLVLHVPPKLAILLILDAGTALSFGLN